MIDFNKKRILVVVAHPDDELLGLGGTLSHIVKNTTAVVRVIILGEGITSRADARDVITWQKELVNHKKNIEDAKAVLGYHELSTYQFPDNRFDDVNLLDLVKAVENEKKIFQPTVVFTHHSGDLNIDHQKTFEAVMTAFRPIGKDLLDLLLTFETPSSTEWQSSDHPIKFTPNYFFELSKSDVERKSQAMECYKYEKRDFPHPRSPKALMILAQSRGISVGKEYVEAFHIIRMNN